MSAFDGLRHDDRPVAPAGSFAQALRDRVELAVARITTIELPERTDIMSDSAPAPASPDPFAPVPTLVPYLVVHAAAAAVDWYREVFGAREVVRYTDAEGKVGHCELAIGGAMLYLADEYPEYGALGPRSIGGSPVQLTLQVPDVDAVWARAVTTGAEVERPVEDQAYGQRSGALVDPFGHHWRVQTHLREMTKGEIEAAMGGEFTIVEPDEPAGAD